MKTKVGVVFAGIAWERFVKHCSHMLVVRQMPLLFQCMEDLDSLPKGKEDKGKDQQPGDEFPWTLVLYD